MITKSDWRNYKEHIDKVDKNNRRTYRRKLKKIEKKYEKTTVANKDNWNPYITSAFLTEKNVLYEIYMYPTEKTFVGFMDWWIKQPERTI